MTEPAEDPTEPTTAKEWKANAHGARRLGDPGLLASVAAVSRMQDLVTRSPALGAVRHLQSSGALARAAEQVLLPDGLSHLDAAVLAFARDHQMQDA